jgi:hypothetical protein
VRTDTDSFLFPSSEIPASNLNYSCAIGKTSQSGSASISCFNHTWLQKWLEKFAGDRVHHRSVLVFCRPFDPLRALSQVPRRLICNFR